MIRMNQAAREQAQQDLQMLLVVLPTAIQAELKATGRENELLEVVMDLGREPSARYIDGEDILRTSEVTQAEIDTVVKNIGDFDDDNRAGMTRTLHRISGIRNRRGGVVGLTCRIGRAVYGTVDIIEDIVKSGQSILLLGRPGVGKTTMLREMARILGDKKRVIIVDTSNEIGGDGDIPHPAVGRSRRMQVPRPSHQHETMIEAVENHNPQVIVIDEIGREREASAARTINERGVQLIGTAHGNMLDNLLLNPTLSDLVGGIESVTLSDEEARRRGTQKTVLERRAPPTFDVLIEIQARQRVAIHKNVAEAVDNMLRGRPVVVEVRFRDEAGKIQIELEEVDSYSPALTGRRGPAVHEVNARGRRPAPANGTTRQSTPVEKGVTKEPGRAKSTTPTPPRPAKKPKRRILPYGIARNRLGQAAKRLGVEIELVNEVAEADVLFTLKSYYRRRQRMISDAEQQRTPIYVLRANTETQMESALADVFNLEATPSDPFESGVAEAERAIERVHSGEGTVSLAPAGASIRRHQHQLARQANLVSHSYGKDPNRHVRIFSTKRG